MTIHWLEVDVFGREPFLGNPLAIVIDSQGLSTEMMARIANWTNFSETTFVGAVDNDGYDLRIFTPNNELPFAGHPSIGTAYTLWTLGLLPAHCSQAVQRCRAGPVEVQHLEDQVRVRVPAPSVQDLSGDHAMFAAAVGAKTLRAPFRIDVGAVWLVAQLPSAAAVRSLSLNFTAIAELSVKYRASGITVYGFDDDGVEVRSFAPAHDIPEDPVCGSGNAAVAAHLHRVGDLDTVGSSYIARQGRAVGRDGQVHVNVDQDGIWIGGRCAIVVRGELAVA